jgi:hypothetical protein
MEFDVMSRWRAEKEKGNFDREGGAANRKQRRPKYRRLAPSMFVARMFNARMFNPATFSQTRSLTPRDSTYESENTV